jgi:hypothetical protein
MKTSVANLRTYTGKERTVRIDRGTPWGNPFKMKEDTPEERARVCQAFRRWWFKADQKELRLRALKELKDCVLLCHCAPKPCHGLTIAAYLSRRSKRK